MDESVDRSDPFNFHTCKTCQYRTKSLRVMLSHVKKHRVKAENYGFCCESSDLEQFECQFCYFETDLKLALDKHTLLVHGSIDYSDPEIELRGYICDKCDFETYSLLVFSRHVCCKEDKAFGEETGEGKNVSDKKFECKHCSFTTRWKRNLQRHVAAKHENPENVQKFYCYHCSYATVQKYHLVRHLKQSHKDINVNNFHTKVEKGQCKFCLKKFKNKKSLYSHRVSRHPKEGERYFRCKICRFKTYKEQYFTRHMEMEYEKLKDVQWMQCEKCLFKTKLAKELRKHRLEHEPKGPVICEKCQKTFINRHTLRKHDKFTHRNSDDLPLFRCKMCPFKTIHQPSYVGHLEAKHRKPEDIKWLQCEHCPFKTTRRIYLQRHFNLRHSTKKKVYRCDKCSFKSDYNKSLKNHLKAMHLNVQQLRCPHCTFKAKEQLLLKRHMQFEHKIQEPLMCDKCPKIFTRRTVLNMHQRLKHGNPDDILWFLCNKCSFKTRAKPYLVSHIKRKHGTDNFDFKCYHCSYKSHIKSYLKTHIQRMHGKSEKSEGK